MAHYAASGMKALAEALTTSRGALAELVYINLSNNQIGDDGMKALGDALKSSKGALPSCKSIYLGGNRGSDAPVKAALAARK